MKPAIFILLAVMSVVVASPYSRTPYVAYSNMADNGPSNSWHYQRYMLNRGTHDHKYFYNIFDVTNFYNLYTFLTFQ